MPANPYNKPLKAIYRCPKAVTPRQVAFLLQKQKDQLQMGRSKPIVGAPKGSSSQVQVLEKTSDDDQDETGNQLDNNPPNDVFQYERIDHGDISSGLDSEDDSDDDYDSDEDQQIISGLARAHYDSRRLRREVQWSDQCSAIIPYFLEFRQATSNWGNPDKWDSDFKTACLCPSHRRRVIWVDMVDLLSD